MIERNAGVGNSFCLLKGEDSAMPCSANEVNGNVSRLSNGVAAKFVKLRTILATIQAQKGAASGAVPKAVLMELQD